MKRFAIIALILSVCVLGAFAKKGKQPIPYKGLPKEVRKEFRKAYSSKDVQFVTIEKKAFKHYEYTLVLADDTQVVFNEKAQVVKAKNPEGVKEEFIPEELVEYIKTTFPNAVITEYEKDSNKQEIVLNDKITLIFKNNGKFLRIED